MEPRPKGSPGAIIETAGHLKQAAAALETNASVAQLALPGAAFAGPARAGLDSGIDAVAACARVAIATLREEAARLVDEAGELRAAQKAWDRRAKEEREEREQRARDLAASKLPSPICR